MATVDAKTAAIILDRALKEAKLLKDAKAKQIDAILCGTHKTYRYILDPIQQKMLTQGSQLCARFGLAGEGA